jgi:hypothetical protein
VDHQRLTRQIREFRAAGYGGFMIIPFPGLPYDFLAEPWLDAVGVALQEAPAELSARRPVESRRYRVRHTASPVGTGSNDIPRSWRVLVPQVQKVSGGTFDR